MSTYLHPALKQFADQQVRYAPHDLKRQQLDRAETLLAEVGTNREYPYQYVCFRITDYRPETYPDLVLTGQDLQHDLRLFIEELAASAPPSPVAEAGQPVLTVEELSRRYNISTKTVNRANALSKPLHGRWPSPRRISAIVDRFGRQPRC